MLFNPTKCYKMSVYQSRSAVVKDYTLCNQTLVAVQPHPCLGILLSSDLRWNPHVDKIAKKGNSTLAFVKRKLYACSEESITCQATSRVCDCSMGSLQTESCGETVSSLKSCSQIYYTSGRSRPSDNGGAGHPDPEGKPVSKKILKNFFLALWAPVWSKIRGGRPPRPLPWIHHCKHDYDYNTNVSKLKKSLSLELLSERRKSHHLQIFHK